MFCYYKAVNSLNEFSHFEYLVEKIKKNMFISYFVCGSKKNYFFSIGQYKFEFAHFSMYLFIYILIQWHGIWCDHGYILLYNILILQKCLSTKTQYRIRCYLEVTVQWSFLQDPGILHGDMHFRRDKLWITPETITHIIQNQQYTITQHKSRCKQDFIHSAIICNQNFDNYDQCQDHFP